MRTFNNENAAEVDISEGKNPIVLQDFQEAAMKKMGEYDSKGVFNGLLVLPTGAGKTLTAAYWLLKNAIDKKKKVLWIAHRHLLLEQAAETFVLNGYKDLLQNRTSYKYRIISGMHDKPIHIEGDEDILICGKDSIVRSLNALDRWMGDSEVYLVIDEAHHAVARTYRKIIDYVKQHAKLVKLLGLTATPYRTNEDERATLGHIFTDDIIYSVDLVTLIERNCLSTPHFESNKTGMLIGEDISPQMVRSMMFSDKLPEDIAKKVVKDSKRNRLIVDTYCNNKDKYQQTIIFAVDVDHAISLNSLFKERGVKSDYVVSSLRDAGTGINRSKEKNDQVIDVYREKKLEVLINVMILTEGTDLPQTKTVFLTRPTISTVLMTQMVGRALRGEKAGGTKEAYIVSFIDEWEDKISFVTPETILLDGEDRIPDKSAEYQRQNIRLIAVSLIEEFARIVDETVDTKDIENLPFSARIPLGLYETSYMETDPETEESMEHNHHSLVYTTSRDSYQEFIDNLPDLMAEFSVTEERIPDDLTVKMINECRKRFFDDEGQIPPVKDIDIESILKHYAYTGNAPRFIEIDKISREKANLSYIAQDMLDLRLDRYEEKEHLLELWNDENTQLKLFYTDYEYFKRQFDKEIDKILDGKVSVQGPVRKWEQRELEKMTLHEWISHDPISGNKLKNEVFEAAKDSDEYVCAMCHKRSNSRRFFQIDHIKPMSKGGLTVRDNLQLLCRECNLTKSDHEDDMPLSVKEVIGDVIPGVEVMDKKVRFTAGNEEKTFAITPNRKTRGYMDFSMAGHTYRYKFKSGKIETLK